MDGVAEVTIVLWWTRSGVVFENPKKLKIAASHHNDKICCLSAEKKKEVTYRRDKGRERL